MKIRILYIFTVAAFALSLFFSIGCSDQLDSIRPRNQIEQSQLSESDINKLVNGVYSVMEDFTFAFFFDWDVKGENYKAGPGFSLNDPISMSPSDSDILSKWRSAYDALKEVNFLVETYENASDKEAPAFKIAGGTGYMFRAFIYYNLVTRWGGVPVMEKRSNGIIAVSSETAVWEFIKNDLTMAGNLLPDFSDKYYLSKSACDALSARVYLALNDHTAASSFASAVINSQKFKLSSASESYAGNFVSNTSGGEIIFCLANKRSSSYKLFYNYVNDIDGSWEYAPSDDCYSSLFADTSVKTGDIRSKAAFGVNPDRLIKFPNGQEEQFISNPEPRQTPIMVFRLPEIYLLLAEAQGNNATGFGTLQIFMENRYNVVNISSGITDRQYQELILDERHRELYGEGFRWYDLKRTGRLDLFKTLNGRDHLMYYPLPQNEIDLAGKENYPQNYGY